MAATQPVWLNKASMAKVKRAVMAEVPLRRVATGPGEFSPAQRRLSKGLTPHRFSEGSGASGR
jgi:hypothetical protein